MEATERFRELATLPDASLPLDEVALVVAAHAHRGLRIDSYLWRLDDLAGECPTPTLDGLMGHLFREGRFRGNGEDYYDPGNSFLSDVLDRGLGIPITLSILAMEVGRRLGVPLSGIGMPGHFLVRDKVDTAVFVDPYHQGRMIDELGCRRLHTAMVGPGAPWDPAWLDPVGRWAIVSRMLANLQAIYTRRQDPASLGWVLHLRSIVPGAGVAEHAAAARHRAPYN